MTDSLAILSGATRALAEVSSASEAWELARTAEAARRYAQMKNLGLESVNYAAGIKAKAMILLADFVDAGQADGTIRKAEDGRPKSLPGEKAYTLQEVLGTKTPEQAYKANHQAHALRAAIGDADIDTLVKQANEEGDDFALSGLRRAAARADDAKDMPPPEPVAPRPGTYSCIVIDPPWPMQKIERDKHPDQGVKLDYPTMSIEDIADEATVPVRTHAADDCHIYLWVTHKFLPAGIDLLGQWGFNYQCVMTWRKNVGFTPFSWMYDTEHVLFGRRGNLPLLRNGLRLSFEAKTQGHSIKPDVFYDRVREASPGPRIDMFPGVEHEGFEPWGLEATHRVG